MCSVVGYIGEVLSRDFVIEGLSRLEYRGYDSAGFACIDQSNNRIVYEKAAGKLENLRSRLTHNPIDGRVCIGHTRWSTHGVSSDENAHPHFDSQHTIAVVHNGIIENYRKLRAQLETVGHLFYSQTDTEVIAHVLEQLLLQHSDLHAAVTALVSQLEGAYALYAFCSSFLM